MKIRTAYSTRTTTTDAVADIRAQLGASDARLVIFFASPAFPPQEIARQMAGAFPDSVTFGCSTAGEIVTGKMLSHAVVAMAFGPEAVRDVRVEVLEHVGSGNPVDSAFAAFDRNSNVPLAAMDPERYLGIILVDGLSNAEERLMDRIGDLTNINFVGGSAGDDLAFAATHVYANGRSYTNAAVLAVVEPACRFSLVKTQSFVPLPQKLQVTKVNEATREILEFDHQPAATAYAAAVGASVEEAPRHFMTNPLGIVFDGEPYVLSPQRINGESMHFCCGVKEGMELQLLASTDILADTKEALRRVKEEQGAITGIIEFNCILRTLELRDKELLDAYGAIFANVPTVGFSTYGEQYIGHMNQTAMMIAFH
ncbi:MAG TPA: FIST N-terminal domain-containing protein [Geobacteraceae bacterium]